MKSLSKICMVLLGAFFLSGCGEIDSCLDKGCRWIYGEEVCDCDGVTLKEVAGDVWTRKQTSPEYLVYSAATAPTGDKFNSCFSEPKGGGAYGVKNWDAVSVLSVRPSKWIGKKKWSSRVLSPEAVDVWVDVDWKDDKHDKTDMLFIADRVNGLWLLDGMMPINEDGSFQKP